MSEFEPDQLFLRFVRDGDVAAVGRLFDEAAPQLARMAWHLVHDASEVEDLVQATFLTALDSAQKFEASKPVMPWLLAILVNHARNARRAAARRPHALTADVVDPSEFESDLERREVLEVIARAVAELPETYRGVITAWWSDGATPSEIAARTGRPAATVRVQLRRGLELLRKGMPAGVTALGASRGLSHSTSSAMRERVVLHASELASTLLPSAALSIGGVAMTWILWVGGALVVVALAAGWWSVREPTKPTVSILAAELATRDEVRAVERPLAPSEASDDVRAPDARRIQPTSVPTPASGWWLLGRTDVDVGEDVAHVSNGSRKVETNPGLAWTRDVRGRAFEVDLTHLFAEPVSAPAELVLRYDHPRFMPSFVRIVVAVDGKQGAAQGGSRVEFSGNFSLVPAQLTVRGFVAPELTRTAFAALFELDESGVPTGNATEQSRCESDGSFLVRSSFAGEHALAVSAPGRRPMTIVLSSPQAHVVELGGLALEGGARLTGRVIDAPDSIAGYVMAKALERMSIARAVPGPLETWTQASTLGWIGGAFEWTSVRAPLGSAREFAMRGLASTEYSLEAEFPTWLTLGDPAVPRLSAWRPNAPSDTSRFAATTDGIEIKSGWGARRSLRLAVHAGGVPVTGARVVLVGIAGTRVAGDELIVEWRSGEAIEVHVSKDGVGEASFTVLPDELADGGLRIVELE